MLYKNNKFEYLIAGLGNPGEKYLHNRHNAGFMCVDYLAQKLNFKVNKIKFKSLCGEANINGHNILVIKPQTYMNLSGEAVQEAASYYKITASKIIIIFDDIYIDAGAIRIKRRGTDGGHNGIKNIIANLNTIDIPRIKIGVGSPAPGTEMMTWVLNNIPQSDREAFYKAVENSFGALMLMINGDIEKAMNLYN